jgi:hypothetical protein
VRRIAGALLVAASACGIDAVGSREIGASGEDGGVGDAAPTLDDVSAPMPIDAGSLDASDGAPDATTCTVVIDDAFGASSAGWQLHGSAAYGAGRVDLTADLTSQAGAMFWPAPLSFGTNLSVEVDYSIVASDGIRAEGLTVAWLDTSTPYVLGPIGGGLALCGMGLSGTAITLDSRDSRLVTLSSIDGACGTSGAITIADVAAASKVVVDIRADRLEGTLATGQTTMRLRANPTTGFFGLTASTGSSGSNSRAQHAITRVKVTSCQ